MRKLILVILCLGGIAIWWLVPADEARVMDDFMYSKERMESQLTVPLKRAGSSILPTVLEAIKKREMPRRRYAIGFIGTERYEPALPVLEDILQDESEIWYFRADALEAIYRIDQGRAIELSQAYVGEQEWLGRFARNIQDGKPLLTLD